MRSRALRISSVGLKLKVTQHASSLGAFIALAVFSVPMLLAVQSAQAQTVSTLYSFCSETNCMDGSGPHGTLIKDKDGNFYGTTNSGGAYSVEPGFGYGTVFELTLSGEQWSEKVLHSFGATGDGATPNGVLVFDGKGNLYGTTMRGGAFGYGTVFELTPSGSGWTETILHSFGSSSTDGTNPAAGLILVKDKLYGTTETGGTNNYETVCPEGCGTVFELALSKSVWKETVLYNFCSDSGCTDGGVPVTAVLDDSEGNLYGTTADGGADSYGTVFKLTPSGSSWTETVIHSFAGGVSDGAAPQPGDDLVSDKSGNIYGVTLLGGDGPCTAGCGTVFEVTSSGTESVIFANFDEYFWPWGPLVLDSKGNLYGTTAYSSGSVYELTPSNGTWTLTLLHVFNESQNQDGFEPYGGVIFGKDGVLYGTTAEGGANYPYGNVFALTPKKK
jgi:uncharacterized repeat protein (TIGR03803 family)